MPTQKNPAQTVLSLNRIPSLDGIRAIAVLMVVASHLSVVDPFPFAPGLGSNAMGNAGVRIFFVLSGFLITSLLMREESMVRTIDLRRFYERRAFRIFPAFYTYIAVVAIFEIASAARLSRVSLLSAICYYSDYIRWDAVDHSVRHSWSLAVEEQFYLLWPLVFKLFPRRRLYLLIAVILVSPFWRYLIFSFPEWGMDSTIDRRFDAISDVLAFGCLLALCRERLWKIRVWRDLHSSRWFRAVTALLLCGGLTMKHPRTYYLAGQTMLNCGLMLVIDHCIRFPDHGIGKLLNWMPLMKLGTISYSLYLWQQVFLDPDGHHLWNNTILALFLSVAAASVSFFTVEQPVLRYRDRMAGTKAARIPAAAA